MRTLHFFVAGCCLVAGLVTADLRAAPFAYIPNADSNNVSVIDTANNVVIATVPVGFHPVGVNVNAAGTRAYIANVGSDNVSVIDTATNAVVATVPVGAHPSSVASDPAGKWIYVGGYLSDDIAVIDAASNKVVATIPVASHPMDLVVDAAGQRLYVTGPYADTVWVIDTATYAVISAMREVPFAGGVAINAMGTRLYVTNIDANSVSVVDTLTNYTLSVVQVGSAPVGVALSPAGNRVYVTNADSNTVSVIDTSTLMVVATVHVGLYPVGIAVDPAGTHIYVANGDSNTVSVIDNGTNKVVATVRVGTSPYALGHFIGPAASASQSINYQGLWWNSPANSESGWGINLAHQGDVIFATWFTYDATGNAWWLTMTADKTADGVYGGTLYQTNGPPFNATPFDPNQVTHAPVGSGTLTFSSASSGTFAYTVNGFAQSKAIILQQFGTLPTCVWGAQADLTKATNFQDLWWASPAASEAGWGINLTQQGTTIFATWFTYDVNRNPLWYSATAAQIGSNVFTGALYRTSGPAFSAAPFNPNLVQRTPVGTATLTFANGNAGTLAYQVADGANVANQSKAITRQVFRSPGTVCQ